VIQSTALTPEMEPTQCQSARHPQFFHHLCEHHTKLSIERSRRGLKFSPSFLVELKNETNSSCGSSMCFYILQVINFYNIIIFVIEAFIQIVLSFMEEEAIPLYDLQMILHLNGCYQKMIKRVLFVVLLAQKFVIERIHIRMDAMRV
jgi:hypothetical protein